MLHVYTYMFIIQEEYIYTCIKCVIDRVMLMQETEHTTDCARAKVERSLLLNARYGRELPAKLVCSTMPTPAINEAQLCRSLREARANYRG